MANTQEAKTPANAVPGHGDHDRVVMLTLEADGTPRQVAPEFIGDKEAALEATKEQFRQQAVAAKDVELRGVVAGEGEKDDEVLSKAHKAAEKAAESAAEKTVNALHKGLGD
jgi:nickel-dependent lactate racemase